MWINTFLEKTKLCLLWEVWTLWQICSAYIARGNKSCEQLHCCRVLPLFKMDHALTETPYCRTWLHIKKKKKHFAARWWPKYVQNIYLKKNKLCQCTPRILHQWKGGREGPMHLHVLPALAKWDSWHVLSPFCWAGLAPFPTSCSNPTESCIWKQEPWALISGMQVST